MKQDKQDRRSQRTRHLVVSALMELMQEKRYDAITVQDLLDRAGGWALHILYPLL